jgi:hypothetical protein
VFSIDFDAPVSPGFAPIAGTDRFGAGVGFIPYRFDQAFVWQHSGAPVHSYSSVKMLGGNHEPGT